MKKFKNKKTLSAIIIAAAVLSIGSVGFASWVITGGDSTAISDAVGVNVATVNDKRISFVAGYNSAENYSGETTWDWSNVCAEGANNNSEKTLVSDHKAYVVFGPKSGDTSGQIQVSGNGLTDIEHLKVKFTFTLESSATFADSLSTITITPTYPQGLLDLASANYIYNPSSSNAAVTLFNATGNASLHSWTADYQSYTVGSTGSFTIKTYKPTEEGAKNRMVVEILASWGWGTNFSGTYPGNDDNNAATVNTIVNNLNALNSSINAMNSPSSKYVSFSVAVTSK